MAVVPHLHKLSVHVPDTDSVHCVALSDYILGKDEGVPGLNSLTSALNTHVETSGIPLLRSIFPA